MFAVNCPVCVDVSLIEVERENVLIDVCRNCKGIWLDRGELETIFQALVAEQNNKSIHSEKPSKKKNKITMLDILGDLILFW